MKITELESGTIVKVNLGSNPRRVPKIEGFFSGKPTQDRRPLNKHEFRRVIGFNRREFIARVHTNNTVDSELIIDVHDPRNRGDYYRMIIPYKIIFRLQRLVYQAFTSLTDTQERLRRNAQRNRYAPQKVYFHPFDKFAPVRLV